MEFPNPKGEQQWLETEEAIEFLEISQDEFKELLSNKSLKPCSKSEPHLFPYLELKEYKLRREGINCN